MDVSALEQYNARSIKRTIDLFGDAASEAFLGAYTPSAKKSKLIDDSETINQLDASEIKMATRIVASYRHVKDIPTPGAAKKGESAVSYLSRAGSKSSSDGTLNID